MKVFAAILALCLVIAGAQATGTVTHPGEQIIEYIYNVIQSDMSGDQSQKVIDPTLIADEAACYVQFENMDVSAVKIGAQNILKCYQVSFDQVKAIAGSKVNSMLFAKYKNNLQQCAGVDTIGAKLECIADVTEKYMQEFNLIAMPVQMEVKFCQRYELHKIEAMFYQSRMELEKCLVRVKNNAQSPPVPQNPEVPSAPIQNIKAKIQAQQQQQQ